MATRISTTLGNVTADEEIDNIYHAIGTLSKKLSSLSTATPSAVAASVVTTVLQDDTPELTYEKWDMMPAYIPPPVAFVTYSKWEAG